MPVLLCGIPPPGVLVCATHIINVLSTTLSSCHTYTHIGLDFYASFFVLVHTSYMGHSSAEGSEDWWQCWPAQPASWCWGNS